MHQSLKGADHPKPRLSDTITAIWVICAARQRQLKNLDYNKKLMVITDGIFSMDGDIAKLPEIIEIAAEYDLITYVDDAYGSGILGEGAGTVKHFGLTDQVDFQICTLSKAVGVVGGYVAGKKDLIDWLKARSKPFLFSTSLPAAAVAPCIVAIDIIKNSPELMDRLWGNGNFLKKGLHDLGFEIGNSETPITPCIIGDEKQTQQLSKRLYEEGIYAKAIVFPTVPFTGMHVVVLVYLSGL